MKERILRYLIRQVDRFWDWVLDTDPPITVKGPVTADESKRPGEQSGEVIETSRDYQHERAQRDKPGGKFDDRQQEYVRYVWGDNHPSTNWIDPFFKGDRL